MDINLNVDSSDSEQSRTPPALDFSNLSSHFPVRNSRFQKRAASQTTVLPTTHATLTESPKSSLSTPTRARNSSPDLIYSPQSKSKLVLKSPNKSPYRLSKQGVKKTLAIHDDASKHEGDSSTNQVIFGSGDTVPKITKQSLGDKMLFVNYTLDNENTGKERSKKKKPTSSSINTNKFNSRIVDEFLDPLDSNLQSTGGGASALRRLTQTPPNRRQAKPIIFSETSSKMGSGQTSAQHAAPLQHAAPPPLAPLPPPPLENLRTDSNTSASTIESSGRSRSLHTQPEEMMHPFNLEQNTLAFTPQKSQSDLRLMSFLEDQEIVPASSNLTYVNNMPHDLLVSPTYRPPAQEPELRAPQAVQYSTEDPQFLESNLHEIIEPIDLDLLIELSSREDSHRNLRAHDADAHACYPAKFKWENGYPIRPDARGPAGPAVLHAYKSALSGARQSRDAPPDDTLTHNTPANSSPAPANFYVPGPPDDSSDTSG